MLRLAIYYDNRLGRNDGNPVYTWADLKVREEKKELTIDHLLPNGDYDKFGNYDFNLYIDWGEDAVRPLLNYEPTETPKPNLCWMSDTHLDGGWRIEKAKNYDIVFFAQKQACEEAVLAGVPGPIWLPHAAEPRAYPYHEMPAKKYDLCFIGHINSMNRIEALDRMFRTFPNFYYGQRLFEDAAHKFAESKIVFNVSIRDDINMRIFETLSTGSFLLTNELPTLGELFQDGVHLVTYKDLDDAVEKARYYLEHDEEREKIANAGHEEFMAKHTISHRVDVMLKEINKKLGVTQ